MYLFCAVFILLSMFLAILGEAQANLRDDERSQRRNAESKGETLPSEYGIFTKMTTLISRGLARVPVLGHNLEQRKEAEEEKKRVEECAGGAAVALALMIRFKCGAATG